MMQECVSLTEWCTKNFIRLHPDIKIIKNKTGALGVVAKEDLDPQNEVFFDPEISPEDYPEYEGSICPLIRVPKISIFSARNSYISNVLLDLDIRGIAALIMAFIYEFELKEKSPWHTYFESFGDFQSPNISNLENNQQMEDTYISPDDFESLFSYLCEEAVSIERQVSIPIPQVLNTNNESSFKSFAKICRLISSKCFDIDDFHEVALVPVADLFRGTPEKNQCRFECIDTVCSVCGSIDCEHLENGVSIDDVFLKENETEEDIPINSNDGINDSEEVESSDSDLDMSESEEEEEEEPITEITEEYIQNMEKKMKEAEEEDTDESEDDADDEDQEINDELLDFDIPEYLKDHKDDFGGDIDDTNCCDIVLIEPIKKNEQIFL